MVMGWTAALSPAHSVPTEITSPEEQVRQSRRAQQGNLPLHQRHERTVRGNVGARSLTDKRAAGAAAAVS